MLVYRVFCLLVPLPPCESRLLKHFSLCVHGSIKLGELIRGSYRDHVFLPAFQSCRLPGSVQDRCTS